MHAVAFVGMLDQKGRNEKRDRQQDQNRRHTLAIVPEYVESDQSLSIYPTSPQRAGKALTLIVQDRVRSFDKGKLCEMRSTSVRGLARSLASQRAWTPLPRPLARTFSG
jgi:hypothetical protein